MIDYFVDDKLNKFVADDCPRGGYTIKLSDRLSLNAYSAGGISGGIGFFYISARLHDSPILDIRYEIYEDKTIRQRDMIFLGSYFRDYKFKHENIGNYHVTKEEFVTMARDEFPELFEWILWNPLK